MMKMKKMMALIVVMVLMFALAAVSGCGQQTNNDAVADKPDENSAVSDNEPAQVEDFNPADYPVAICTFVMNHPCHRILQLGFCTAAEELGYEAKIIGSEGSDLSEVYAAAEAFAAEGGKGIMLYVGESSANETIASLASQGCIVGIPHFSFRQEDGSYPQGLSFNMACDPTVYGADVAEVMAKKLDGMTGSVAITQNTKNVTENAAEASFRENWEELNDAGTYDISGIKLLDTQLEGAEIAAATAHNLAIIQANPDIIGAFGTTGNAPITWADAASQAGKPDGEICIVGMDGTEGNLEYLLAGKVYALAAQPLYQEAYLTMEYLDKCLRGEEVPMWTDLDCPIVTLDGQGENGPDYHLDIAKRVNEFFA